LIYSFQLHVSALKSQLQVEHKIVHIYMHYFVLKLKLALQSRNM